MHKLFNRQKGAALIVLTVILVLAASVVFVSQLNGSQIKVERGKKTALALAEAKAVVIGDAVSQPLLTSEGMLRLPDIGHGASPSVPSEGNSVSNFTGNMKNYSVLGKLPWKTLGIEPLKDGYGECLWYVVSGRFKKIPTTDTLNWDTQGQIDVIDKNGNLLATNLAALIIAPEFTLNDQNRSLADAAYNQCGGNYDAKNYLDTYDSLYSIAGEVNYFSGSTNNRLATNSDNKRFVFAKNDYYNDRFIFISVDEIFRSFIKRSDFSAQISALLNDPDFISILNEITITSAATLPPNVKGTGNLGINCECSPPSCLSNKSIANINNQTFCKNWKEMLLLTELSPPMPIIIDGSVTAVNCNRVLIFGGQKMGVQARLDDTDKSDPANYLEDTNLIAFNTPNNDFNGVSTFNAANPSTDILRCI